MGDVSNDGERRGGGRRRKVARTQRKTRATGRGNLKGRGQIAEMEFMLAAAKKGFGVGKPFGDNERYDCVVDAGGHLWRVQVKLSTAKHHRGFAVRASWRNSHRGMPYTRAQIDFMVVFLVRWSIWYVIPVRALRGRLTIHLYPFGTRKGGKGFLMEKYREAWQLLGKPWAHIGSTF